ASRDHRRGQAGALLSDKSWAQHAHSLCAPGSLLQIYISRAPFYSHYGTSFPLSPNHVEKADRGFLDSSVHLLGPSCFWSQLRSSFTTQHGRC
ncbi:hypothetical protein T310_8855, partial [Rasamsonia emersonii CBS 393.64]